MDMYLLFSSHRSDIFPVGDLAVLQPSWGSQVCSLFQVGRSPRSSLTRAFSAGKMDKPEMLRAAERWKPYRRCGCNLPINQAINFHQTINQSINNQNLGPHTRDDAYMKSGNACMPSAVLF